MTIADENKLLENLVEKTCSKCRHYEDENDFVCIKCDKNTMIAKTIKRKRRALTHRQLCELGARWINQQIGIGVHFWRILIETGYRKENPDVFAFTKYYSVLIECKASRADFLADKKKPFRQNPQLGIGRMRYYLVNEGVATQEDMPKGWQLLIAYDEDTILMPENYEPPMSPNNYGFDLRNATAETELMWSWLYRKENKCLPVIGEKHVNVIHPSYWKQEGMVEKILKGAV